jgi:hypothetical protein
MSFSRYDHPTNAFSRPAPEPEVRRAIMAKWAMFDQSRAREARAAGVSNRSARP